MRTTLLLNDLCKVLLGLALSTIACHTAFAGVDQDWGVLVGNHAGIKTDSARVKVERPLLLRLRRAEEAAFLPLKMGVGQADSSRWLLLREASRTRGDASFCGAGHEDHLVLINVKKSVGVVRGDFLVQSCLKSISMDIDRFSELIDAIEVDEASGQLSFTQSISGDKESFRQEVHLEVTSGRMKASTRKLDD
ncbi:MAG: hypothetical protein EPO09_21185 [Aquabacterium sp.]|uniref:hypothetical protein n=1 Tax=Aquabacterium sp. TaxID=1872578 RepID=UPI00122378AB|nr:hypothetical protein [Aquabacterium sp.]TAK83772.1 MAG: hypothetical protein EPO09_21185 [Aquabacterium sp.]